jgi:hypothetical protein
MTAVIAFKPGRQACVPHRSARHLGPVVRDHRGRKQAILRGRGSTKTAVLTSLHGATDAGFSGSVTPSARSPDCLGLQPCRWAGSMIGAKDGKRP